MVLERVTVDEDLLNDRALSVYVFKFLWSDVFTLRKLEDVLSSINNFNCSIREDHTHITRADPSILWESLFGPLGVFKIAFENIGTSELDLTSWRIISWEISQFRAVSKADSHGWNHTSHSTWSSIQGMSKSSGAIVFSLAVALIHMNAKSKLEELKYICIDRCRSWDHNSDSSTETIFDLLENGRIIKCRRQISVFFVILLLWLYRLIKKPLNETTLLFYLIMYNSVHSIKDTGNATEQGRLQNWNILK